MSSTNGLFQQTMHAINSDMRALDRKIQLLCVLVNDLAERISKLEPKKQQQPEAPLTFSEETNVDAAAAATPSK